VAEVFLGAVKFRKVLFLSDFFFGALRNYRRLSVLRRLCTDHHTISQDWPTEESFEKKEILKWRDISDAISKIKKVKYRKGKYGDSAILT